MKIFFYLKFLLFFSLHIFAQNSEKITINWTDTDYVFTESNKIKIPNFQAENFIYSDEFSTVTYSKKWKSNSFALENSATISSVLYENITESQLGNLKKSSLKQIITLNIGNSNARDENYIELNFNPIIIENNQIKRATFIEISYQNSSYPEYANKNLTANTIVNSVLKTGTFYKFYIEKSGVYRISKSFLTQLGFNTNVDPRTIQIFGNGGRMIPLTNAVPYPNDLTENAIQFVGEQDGVFNDTDYILFYAEGIDTWNTESLTHANLYADRTYYYVSTTAGLGKRFTPIIQPTASATTIFQNYDDYHFFEKDLFNIGRLGRKWYGNDFKVENIQNFSFSIPNIETNSPLKLILSAAGGGVVATNLKIKFNSVDIGLISFPAISLGGLFANENIFNGTILTPTPAINVGIEYINNGVPSANAYLDYITIECKSKLTDIGKQFKFKQKNAAILTGIGEYSFTNASSIVQIWDITDIYNVKYVPNNQQANFSFKDNLGETKNYIAVHTSDVYEPLKESSAIVLNQDIKGTIFKNKQGNFQDVDYLIVTPYVFYNQAESLANFHRINSNLNTKVVVLEAIYPEFSSGKQDIGAIRNLVKYIYQNASVPSKRLKYLCLFGDSSFDYKNRIPKNTNFVPVFHALYSFSLSSSYMSDDFYGLMDSNEGNMVGFQGLDVAVGRILASSTLQADQMITKVFDYYNSKSYGRWRNNIVMVSDDIDLQSDITIQSDLNSLADNITLQKPFFNVKKLHADSFLQETTSGGQKYPKLRNEFVNSFEQGTLIFNYFGHGGEDGLAQERLFEIKDAKSVVNRYKYPLFITVTCEFTRFDNPFRPTAGEFTYQNPFGGAVSMVTTTRQIGQSTGANFNVRLMQSLLAYGSTNYTTIAEAVRLAKVASGSSGNNVVFYIGDPALQLAIPKPKVVLTKINDQPITGPVDDLKALAFVKLSGEVTDENGNTLNGYNGDLAVQVFDKNIDRITLANDNIYSAGVLQKMNFTTLGETIFRGNASIKNGKFEFGFTVPKDIKIPLGNGKISFYAKTNTPLQNQTGHDFSIKVGGINTNAVADVTAPKIRLYMNDESFINGGITNQSPLFLAFLEDEHGINTASGIGHDIIAYLDGDETKPFILNDFYETELDNYTKGNLKYPFRNLAVGLHTLTFKAWDVYNNIVTADLQFVVVSDETVTLTNVLNYPNPFVNHTEFWFTHNKPGEPLEVQVQIFTITGKIVWTKNQIITTPGSLSRDISWNGLDDFGDKIGKGVYVYKLTVRSTLTNKKTEKIEKLVIL